MMDAYSFVAEDPGQTLRCAINGAGLAVLGDRQLLMQMLANLVENAIRHCPAGISITVSASRVSDLVDVVVTDTGPGIPEAERANVLRRLYRLEKSRTTPGSGLGLSLVNAVVDLHHATMELADNDPGLKITVTFPALTPCA